MGKQLEQFQSDGFLIFEGFNSEPECDKLINRATELTAKLVKEYDLIAIEDLNVKGMSKGILSKQIHDASVQSRLN